MKRTLRFAILTLALVLVLTATAQAGDYALSLGIAGGLTAPTSDAWDELYETSVIGNFGFLVDSELIYGFGPYISLGGSKANNRLHEKIDIEISMVDFGLGVNWRWRALSWLSPQARVGLLAFNAREVISDDWIEYEMKEQGVGLEAATGVIFFPFGGFYNGASGISFGVELTYDYRPLKEMGALEDASGLGVMFTHGYRFDFGGYGRHRPPVAAAPTPAPAPPVQPVDMEED
jgi:Outer membrane protein beta-barrel domain